MAKNIIVFFQKAYHFVRYDVWRITESELSHGKRIGYSLVKTLVLAVRGFIDDQLNVRASALTYSVLFAIVPILALVMGLANGFGFGQVIENALNDSFLGQSNMVPFIMGFVERYLETAQGGVFVGIGIFTLLWAVLSFFQQIENAFNSIWQVKKSRSYIRQFTTYFSILLLFPVLIIASSGISIFANNTVAGSTLLQTVSPLIKFLLRLMPYFLAWIMFTVLYIVMPNTRVRFWNGAVSGLIAGTVFIIFQQLYVYGQVYLSRYNVVYGSFAAIPLLLMFIQISCLITLLGAEIAYASQNVQNFDYETDTKNISRRYKDFITLYITHLIVKNFEQGADPLSAEEIALQNHLPIRLTTQLLHNLVDNKILIEVFNDGSKSKTYQPAMDINKMTIQMLFDTLDSSGAEHFLNGETPQMQQCWQKLVTLQKNNELQKTVLIKDLLD